MEEKHTPEDRATLFADEKYPTQFATWDALYTAYHSGYLDGSRELLQENERLKAFLESVHNAVNRMHKPEYSVFFLNDEKIDGYELADKIKAALNL